MTPEKRMRAFVSLLRYRNWSVALRDLAGPALQASARGALPTGPTVALLSYWFASLYVLTEGWHKLGLVDGSVDSALTSEAGLETLQLFRHAVFHYEFDYEDKKFMGVMTDRATLMWVLELDGAFDAFFAPHTPRPDVQSLASWIAGNAGEGAS